MHYAVEITKCSSFHAQCDVQVGMYAAVLLALLLQADEGTRATAADLLNGSLQGLLQPVAECFEFYVGCGAISARNATTLQTLLADIHSWQLTS